MLRARRSPSPTDSGYGSEAITPAIELKAKNKYASRRGVLGAAERPRALQGLTVSLDSTASLVEQLSAALKERGGRGSDLFHEWNLDG